MDTSLITDYRRSLLAIGRAGGTVQVRLSHVRRFLASVDADVQDLTADDAAGWLASGDWGPAARKSARASLRTFGAWLESTGRGPNFAAGIPPIRQPRQIPAPASDDAVLEGMRRGDEVTALAIEIMATTGLRRAETARIKAKDVIGPSIHGYVLVVIGKGGHVRQVPLPGHLGRRIQDAGGWLFPGNDHGHISPGWLGKKISRVLPPGVTPHKLRHRFATRAYDQSRDVIAVQQLLGHASVATTQLYILPSADAARAAAQTAWRFAA